MLAATDTQPHRLPARLAPPPADLDLVRRL